jgi:DoxX-like protein
VSAPPDEAWAIRALRWTLAIVLGGQAALLVVASLRAASHEHLHVALGVAELLASILILLPRTRLAGAVLLFLTLAGASIVHFASGQTPPPSYAVYVAALVVVGAPRNFIARERREQVHG